MFKDREKSFGFKGHKQFFGRVSLNHFIFPPPHNRSKLVSGYIIHVEIDSTIYTIMFCQVVAILVCSIVPVLTFGPDISITEVQESSRRILPGGGSVLTAATALVSSN